MKQQQFIDRRAARRHEPQRIAEVRGRQFVVENVVPVGAEGMRVTETVGRDFVITSYSIHYTKLYEIGVDSRLGRFVRQPGKDCHWINRLRLFVDLCLGIATASFGWSVPTTRKHKDARD